MSQVSPRRGTGLVLLAATCWATLGLFGKQLYRYEVDPLVLVSLRAAIATLTLGLALAVFRPQWLRIRIWDLPFFAIFGVVGVAMNYASYFLALKWTTMTTTVILFYSYPFLVVLGATVLLKEPLTASKLVALALSLVGLVLVAEAYDLARLDLNRPGVVYSLLAAVATASYNLLGKKSLARYSSWTTLFYALLFGAVSLLLWQGPRLYEAWEYPTPVWGLILGLAWIPTLLGYAAFLLGLADLEAGKASIVAYAELVIAVVLAYIFLGERLSPPQIVGGLLILAALFILQFRTRLDGGREVGMRQETI
jgi:drug/metabolite transporter (DMT)-like permease